MLNQEPATTIEPGNCKSEEISSSPFPLLFMGNSGYQVLGIVLMAVTVLIIIALVTAVLTGSQDYSGIQGIQMAFWQLVIIGLLGAGGKSLYDKGKGDSGTGGDGS